MKTIKNFIILSALLVSFNSQAFDPVWEVKAVASNGAYGVVQFTNDDSEQEAIDQAMGLCEQHTDQICGIVYIKIVDSEE